VVQAAISSISAANAGRLRAPDKPEKNLMWILLVEALLALFLLVFIVWWTMFAGKKPGPQTPDPSGEDDTTGR
jgi:hypothetical protein